MSSPSHEQSAPAGQRKPRANIVAFGLTRIVVMLTGLVVALELVRQLPEETYASYRIIWAAVSLAVAASNLGLSTLITRRVSRAPELASALVQQGLQAVAVLALPTTCAVVGYVAVSTGSVEVTTAAVLGALTLTGNASAQMVSAGLHGLRQMRLEVPAVLLGRVVFAGGTLYLLSREAGLVALYGARAAGAWVAALLLLWQLGRVVKLGREPVSKGAVAELLSEGRTFGATVLFGAIYAQADVLVLQWMRDAHEVARYAAPSSILLQLALIATVLSRGFFPVLSRVGRDADRAADIIAFQSRMLLLVSVPVAVGGLWLAPRFVPWVLGETYARSAVGPFMWLVLAVPVRFLNNGLGLSLTALDKQPERARIDRVGAVFNLAANALVVPWWGAEGAAITTLCTDVLLCILLRQQILGIVPRLMLWRAWGRALWPAVAMAVALYLLPSMHVALEVLLGALVYVVVGGLSGSWRRADLARLRRV